jgi:hypothetical protein
VKAAAALAVVLLAAGCGGGAPRPTFHAAPGWQAGSSGSRAWASTVAYRDCRDCVPPHRTIAALPPNGVIIQLASVRSRLSRDVGSWPPRIRLHDVQPGFEGVPYRYGFCERSVQNGRVVRWVYVWFGRARPTPRQLAKANAELARLSL